MPGFNVRRCFTSPLLSELAFLKHGFGSRGLSLPDLLGHEIDIVTPQTKQIHSATVHLLKLPLHRSILEGDAFLTQESGVVCAVRTADCVPILIADSRREATGAIHAGWRGTAARVTEEAVSHMTLHFGSDPEDLVAAIGPAICQQCYEVSEEVVDAFDNSALPHAKKRGSKYLLDLRAMNRSQLIASGLKESRISVMKDCTACNPHSFASYRREKTKERQISFIVNVMIPRRKLLGFLRPLPWRERVG